MRLLKSRPRALLLAVAVAVILAATVATQVAQAQDPLPPHDLAISLEEDIQGHTVSKYWTFVLTNRGGQDAHSGQVKFSFTPHAGGTIVMEEVDTFRVPAIPLHHGYFDPVTGIWHFKNIRAGQTIKVGIRIRFQGGPVGQHTKDHLVLGRAEIVSFLPKEEPMLLYNNLVERWWSQDNSGSTVPAQGDAEVGMRLSSNQFPKKNDTVNFTIQADVGQCSVNSYSTFDAVYDLFEVRVKVNHSPGLELASAQAPMGTVFDRSTGVWDVGSLSGRTPECWGNGVRVDMPVSFQYTGDVPLEDACLTAELDNVFPPETVLDPGAQRNNRVRICLGEDPTVLVSGSVRAEQILEDFKLIEFFPCVGKTAYPCNEQDTLELVADIPAYDAGIDRDGAGRIINIGGGNIFQPNGIVIQVGDT